LDIGFEDSKVAPHSQWHAVRLVRIAGQPQAAQIEQPLDVARGAGVVLGTSLAGDLQPWPIVFAAFLPPPIAAIERPLYRAD